MIDKLKTYFLYFWEYIIYGDFESIVDAVRFLFYRRGSKRNRRIRSRIGTFYARRDTNDFQYVNYYYEWSVKRFVLKYQAHYHYFLDIGAGIGEYSFLMNRLGKKVFLFEPHPGSYRVVRLSMTRNPCENMSTYSFGLGSEQQEAYILLHHVNTGASRIIKPGEPVPQGEMVSKTSTKTLDALQEELNMDVDRPVMMKIDVEGMEVDVIKGAKDFLQRHKEVLIIIEDKHSGEDEVRNALAEIGSFHIGRVDELNLYAKKKDH